MISQQLKAHSHLDENRERGWTLYRSAASSHMLPLVANVLYGVRGMQAYVLLQPMVIGSQTA